MPDDVRLWRWNGLYWTEDRGSADVEAMIGDAGGVHYYVDGGASEFGDGYDWEIPLETIQEAVDLADGVLDTWIHVKPSTYDEEVTIAVDHVHILADTFGSINGMNFVVSGDYCTMHGCFVNRLGNDGFVISGDYAVVDRCFVGGMTRGVYINGGNYCSIDESVIVQCTSHGIECNDDHNLIRNNIVINNTGTGIYFSHTNAEYCTIEHNTVSANAIGVHLVAGADNNVFGPNHIKGNTVEVTDAGTNNSWYDPDSDSQTYVYTDSILGLNSTAYPYGSPQEPTSTIDNAVVIAGTRNIRCIRAFGAHTLAASVAGYHIEGCIGPLGVSYIDLGNQSVAASLFCRCRITGAINGFGYYDGCIIQSVTACQGFFNDCTLYGTNANPITMTAGSTNFNRCTGLEGTAYVDCNGNPTLVNFEDYSGSLFLRGLTGGVVNVRAKAGCNITIENTCTGGAINIYGDAEVTDNSGGGCTVTLYTLQDRTKGLTSIYDLIAALPGVDFPETLDIVIYPVAEDAATDEIADDGSSPAVYPAVADTTSALVGTPAEAWGEDVQFDEVGTVQVLSIFVYLHWQTMIDNVLGHSYSKMQMTNDGGTTWVDMTDDFDNQLAAMTERIRSGVGRWFTTIDAGVEQLGFRLLHWVDNAIYTSSAQIFSDSYIRITIHKT